MLGRNGGTAAPRWKFWPPVRALQIERGETSVEALVEHDEQRLSNEPRTWASEIDPQYPVFGNPLTATVRANFAFAKDEIEDLYRRIAALEGVSGLGVVDGGTW